MLPEYNPHSKVLDSLKGTDNWKITDGFLQNSEFQIKLVFDPHSWRWKVGRSSLLSLKMARLTIRTGSTTLWLHHLNFDGNIYDSAMCFLRAPECWQAAWAPALAHKSFILTDGTYAPLSPRRRHNRLTFIGPCKLSFGPYMRFEGVLRRSCVLLRSISAHFTKR